MTNGKELRLAVAMTGGVSLAVWMGGVATELLQLATALRVPESEKGLTESQKAYRQWLHDNHYESARLDVLVGTSAGGLNSALLGAAVAWNVTSRDFITRLRATWLSVGALQSLLRSPFESEPASLLRGDDYFKPQVDMILSDWHATRNDQGKEADGPMPVHVIITCTLLDPVEVPYVDQGGRSIIEIDHRGVFEFNTDDLTEDPDAPKKLALAARTSASYPGAFEASWIPIEEKNRFGRKSLNLSRNAELDSSRYAIDGGVLANKPLGRAFRAIFDQPSDTPVDRKLMYVVPVSSNAKEDSDPPREDKPPTIAQVLGATASIPLSQTLRDDLADIRDHEHRMLVQQAARKQWLAQLDGNTRDAITRAIWDLFTSQRRMISVTGTLSDAMRRRQGMQPGNKILRAVSDGRKAVDWHRGTFQETFEDEHWPWGLHALTYMSQVILDIVRESADAIAEKASATPGGQVAAAAIDDLGTRVAGVRRELHKVLREVRLLRQLDHAFWDAALEMVAHLDDPTEWQEWSTLAYSKWPKPPDEWVEPRPEGATDKASKTVRTVARKLSEKSDRFRDHDLGDQEQVRMLLSEMAGTLKESAMTLIDLHRKGAPLETPLGLSEESRKLVEALDAEPGSALRFLAQLWVIQVATQPGGISVEQPVDLVLVHSDHRVTLDPRERGEAGTKLAGLQLARFGAFYKRSWRANDFLWGRLDAVQRIGEMLGGDVEELQKEIVAEEAKHLLSAIEHSEADGAYISADAKTLRKLILNSKNGKDDAADILEACRLGEERFSGELKSDSFVATATQALAVGTNVFRSEQGGLGPVRTLFGYLRNGMGLPSYLLGQAITSSGKTGLFLIALAMAFVIGVAAVALFVQGAQLSQTVILIAGGIALFFYLWVAIVGGAHSFFLAGVGLLIIGVAVVSQMDAEGARVGIGVAVTVLVLLAVIGAALQIDWRGQLVFTFTALVGSLLWTLHNFGVDWLPGTDVQWAWVPLWTLLAAHVGLVIFTGGPFDRVRESERKRLRRSARRAPRIIAVNALLIGLLALDLAVMISKGELAGHPPWDEVIRFINANAPALALVALAIPVILGILIRPGIHLGTRRI